MHIHIRIRRICAHRMRIRHLDPLHRMRIWIRRIASACRAKALRLDTIFVNLSIEYLGKDRQRDPKQRKEACLGSNARFIC